ncbi:hypothetical protein GCM10017083_20050 [Thalassobaculum fulvum]|uniref:Uncharacterized protein n=1 Tax=Thalassobaculum fulvum TaxID=1633335 RepID=A0A918XR26_9PROT|nr:hypothetical protein [Thalassobaculum fulvum]GHD48691.1 hypothetical protein GCM10017083_20050 [Thalassobaculum fulvum]
MSDGRSRVGPPEPPGATPTRRRARYKPWTAAIVLLCPVLFLLVLDAAALVQAFLDPESTCWLKPLKESGGKVLFPFEIHLLFFSATLPFWAPVIVLLAAMFWYVEWIRLGELAAVVAVAAVVLYLTGVDFAWMVELYDARFRSACG